MLTFVSIQLCHRNDWWRLPYVVLFCLKRMSEMSEKRRNFIV